MKIFFDVDGVLVDGWHANPELRKPWNATIDIDLGVSLDEFERLFFIEQNHPLGSVMNSCVAGERDLKEALEEVLPQVGYTGHVDDFVQYWFEKDSNVSTEVLQIVSALQPIPGVELFIATGQEHYRATYLWSNLEISRLFKQIFYSADIVFLKNDVRFFDEINCRLGISATEIPVFFDDREEVVRLAGQAGWDAAIFETVDDISSHPRLRSFL